MLETIIFLIIIGLILFFGGAFTEILTNFESKYGTDIMGIGIIILVTRIIFLLTIILLFPGICYV